MTKELELLRDRLLASARHYQGASLDPINRRCKTEMLATADLLREAAATLAKTQEGSERDILEVIDQRDYREQIIDDILDAVLGADRPEWSSVYCFVNAVDDVRERMDTLTAQQKAPDGEAEAHLGRVGEPVGYVHPDTIKGLQAGLCTKSYLFAKPMPQVWADVPLYTTPQLPVGVPDGWVLVPKVATKEMLDAGVDAAVNKAKGNPWCPYAWSAMLAAAPQPDSAALTAQQKAPEGEPRDYCLQLLVAAGHITQELADQTRAIANSVVAKGEDHG